MEDSTGEATSVALHPCPACGNKVAGNASFCPSCGYNFAGAAGTELRYAGAWVRFFAALVDSLVILIPDIIIFSASGDFVMGYLLAAGLGFVYHVGFWTISGATPGKMLFGLKVMLKDGSPITAGAAVVRYIGYIVNSFTLGIGYFVILFNEQKRGLHDYLAGTIVVSTR